MTDQEARAILNVLHGLAELVIEDLQSKNENGFIQEGQSGVEVRELLATCE